MVSINQQQETSYLMLSLWEKGCCNKAFAYMYIMGILYRLHFNAGHIRKGIILPSFNLRIESAYEIIWFSYIDNRLSKLQIILDVIYKKYER